jgi:hypothetical protein
LTQYIHGFPDEAHLRILAVDGQHGFIPYHSYGRYISIIKYFRNESFEIKRKKPSRQLLVA